MKSKLLVAVVAVAALAGCGGDDSEPAAETTPAAAAEPDLGAIKDYLLEHTTNLQEQTATLAADAEAYHAAAEEAGFDYAKLLADRRDEVAGMVEKMQATFRDGQPGLRGDGGRGRRRARAGRLRRHHRRGRDKSDPENGRAVLDQDARRQDVRAARQFHVPARDRRCGGPSRKFAAKGVKADLDGDGKVEFGEAVPDADFLVAAAKDFATNAKDLDTAARAWEPTDAGRVHRARRDDADDVRVLRGVEAVALRRGRQVEGERVRGRLAAPGHRRHPRRARARLRPGRAARSRRPTRSRPSRPAPS